MKIGIPKKELYVASVGEKLNMQAKIFVRRREISYHPKGAQTINQNPGM